MNAKEKELLNILQNGLPLVSRPFLVIGEQMGISEEEVMDLYKGIESKGLIRRFGGIVNISEIGVASTLVGLKVQVENLAFVASVVNQYEGVTHNYERDDPFNLWFTLMEASQQELENKISSIEALEEVQALVNLPAKQKFKTKVILKL